MNLDELKNNVANILATVDDAGELDVLICGRCDSVFHLFEDFSKHRNSVQCFSKVPVKDRTCSEFIRVYKLYQKWCQLDHRQKDAWIAASMTALSFVREIKNENKFSLDFIDGRKKKTNYRPHPNKRSSEEDSDEDDNSTEDDNSEDHEVNELYDFINQDDATCDETLESKKNRIAKKTVNGTDETIPALFYYAENILGRRYNVGKKTFEYLIKWEGCADDENTWEPRSHLRTCPKFLEKFELELGQQIDTKSKKNVKKPELAGRSQQGNKTKAGIEVQKDSVRNNVRVEIKFENSLSSDEEVTTIDPKPAITRKFHKVQQAVSGNSVDKRCENSKSNNVRVLFDNSSSSEEEVTRKEPQPSFARKFEQARRAVSAKKKHLIDKVLDSSKSDDVFAENSFENTFSSEEDEPEPSAKKRPQAISNRVKKAIQYAKPHINLSRPKGAHKVEKVFLRNLRGLYSFESNTKDKKRVCSKNEMIEIVPSKVDQPPPTKHPRLSPESEEENLQLIKRPLVIKTYGGKYAQRKNKKLQLSTNGTPENKTNTLTSSFKNDQNIIQKLISAIDQTQKNKEKVEEISKNEEQKQTEPVIINEELQDESMSKMPEVVENQQNVESSHVTSECENSEIKTKQIRSPSTKSKFSLNKPMIIRKKLIRKPKPTVLDNEKEKEMKPNQSIPKIVRRVICKSSTTDKYELEKASPNDNYIKDAMPRDLSPVTLSIPEPDITLCALMCKSLTNTDGEKTLLLTTEPPKPSISPAELSSPKTEAAKNNKVYVTTVNAWSGSEEIVLEDDNRVLYQIAGKSETGETLLIPTNMKTILAENASKAEDTPPCALDQENEESIMLDSQVLHLDQNIEMLNSEFPQVAVQIEGDDGNHVVAQLLEIGPPSPGGTRKTVFLLPDGNLNSSELSAEQYDSITNVL